MVSKLVWVKLKKNNVKQLQLVTGIFTDTILNLKEEGKNPFSLDSKEPTENFQDFLKGEVRYASLAKAAPDVAEELFAKTEQDAKDRSLKLCSLTKRFRRRKIIRYLTTKN